jgi:hypothetical protein
MVKVVIATSFIALVDRKAKRNLPHRRRKSDPCLAEANET